jgi:hypothetical protein
VKIFFDENFSPHLAKGFAAFQAGRKSESIEVLHCTDKFARGTRDEDWLPQVAKMHGVVITQDLNIHRMKAQWAICEQYKVGIFFFRPPKKMNYTYWQWISEVLKHWAKVKELAKNSTRPFAFEITPKCSEPKPI